MDKFVEKSADFAGFFGTNFAEKQSAEKQPILWLFLGQISLEIDQFSLRYFGFFVNLPEFFSAPRPRKISKALNTRVN